MEQKCINILALIEKNLNNYISLELSPDDSLNMPDELLRIELWMLHFINNLLLIFCLQFGDAISLLSRETISWHKETWNWFDRAGDSLELLRKFPRFKVIPELL